MSIRRSIGIGLLASLVALALVAAGVYAGRQAAPASSPAAPSIMSYQGLVSVDGSPFEGTGHFKFAIVDASGTTTFWSNDGTSSGGSEPTHAVELAVSQGQFDVLLGDTSIPNMTLPLDPPVFSGAERYLRLWFSPDGISYEQLSPDRRIASVPYALQAQQADTLDGFHAGDLALPGGAMVLSESPADPGLIGAGFSPTGAVVRPQAWASRSRMPTPRSYFGAAEVNGIIYAIGGSNGAGGTLAAVEAYNPVTDAWTARASMPTARSALAVVAVDGIIYAIGGHGAEGVLATVEAYNPAANTWSAKAPMPTARRFLAAAAWSGVVYALGGYGIEDSPVADVEAYNPASNSWTARAPMPTERAELASAAADGVIYAVGGFGSNWNPLATVEAYNPAGNSWSTRTPMAVARNCLGATALQGAIYAIGGGHLGSSGPFFQDVVEVYDPATDTWAYQSHMLAERSFLSVVAVGDSIYALGGNLPHANEVFAPQPPLYVYRKD